MINGIRIIDLEHHFATEPMWRAVYKTRGMDYDNPDMSILSPETVRQHHDECDLEGVLFREMDSARIDYSHLSLSGGIEGLPMKTAKKLSVESNDILGKTIAKHPDRVGGWMALVPKDIEWSLSEIDRCANMGLWGWSTMSNYGKNGRLDAPKYRPLIARCSELGMPIFIHPQFPVNKELNEVGYCLDGPAFGFTMDTQLTFLRMIYCGIFDEFPDLHIVLGHNAEGLAVFVERIDTARRQGMGQPFPEFGHIEHAPSYYLYHNLVGNTSGSFSKEVLQFTKEAFGKDFLVLGTDYPYENSKAAVDLILENDQLTFDEKKSILQDNAEALGFGVSHIR